MRKLKKLFVTRAIGGGGVAWTHLLQDTFSDDRAAGAVNGTLSDSGHVRTVVDTGSIISISSGHLRGRGGLYSIATQIRYPPVSRVPGIVLRFTHYNGAPNIIVGAGFFAEGQPSARVHVLDTSWTQPSSVDYSVSFAIAPEDANAAEEYCIALRSAGAFVFQNNQLIFHTTINNNTTLVPTVYFYRDTNGDDYFDNLCVAGYWLPSPLVSDGFGSSFGTSDGLGHAETSGIGSGGSGATWTTQSGTFGITSARAYTTTLSGGIATVSLSTADVYLSCKLYRSSNQVGVIVRWTDANNYIRVVHDGTNIVIVKRVAGTETTVGSVAKTYSAGAALVVDAIGTAFRIYYNDALVTTTTISDSALQSGTSVGLYTSDTSNQMDDFVVYAKGSGGEYAVLGTI